MNGAGAGVGGAVTTGAVRGFGASRGGAGGGGLTRGGGGGGGGAGDAMKAMNTGAASFTADRTPSICSNPHPATMCAAMTAPNAPARRAGWPFFAYWAGIADADPPPNELRSNGDCLDSDGWGGAVMGRFMSGTNANRSQLLSYPGYTSCLDNDLIAKGASNAMHWREALATVFPISA
jgi:hypothetical protein